MRKLHLLPLIILLLAACSLFQPDPELVWDKSPEAPLIRATEGGGLEPRAAAVNRIPEAQLWGDGRIIWTTFDEESERQVWQGRLGEPEIEELLQEFADQGFFRLNDHYAPRTEVFDSGTTALRVNLASERKSVSEYHEGAPASFHRLYGLVSSGAGANGEPYFPETGYLTAEPMSYRGDDPIPQWDAGELGVDLDDALGGVWVEGPALGKAWEIVNLKYWAPRVQQGEQIYELYLEIPDLTGRDPQS